MRRYPSGVVIITTVDQGGHPHGFTASSFTSVALDPPTILFCLAASAECYEAFHAARDYGISVLAPAHAPLAKRFATRGADKFSSFDDLELADGRYFVKGALARLACTRSDEIACGDHGIFIAVVGEVAVEEQDAAMVHYRGGLNGIWHAGSPTPAPTQPSAAGKLVP
jgi:flavin reductase ActVB